MVHVQVELLQEQICISCRDKLYPIEPKSDNIGGNDGDNNEFESFNATPQAFQVFERWGNKDY